MNYELGSAMQQFDVEKIRVDFPILKRKIHGKRLTYLDNAATTQKPRQVVEAERLFYEEHNANVHRGIHTLGDEATRLFSEARETIAQFVGASRPEELIFTRNTTEGINLVAYAWGGERVKKGDVIVTTEMEHHSNIVPWQILAQRNGARVEYVRVDDDTGQIDWKDLEAKLKLRPKLLAVVQVSNFLGTVNPIEKIVELTRKQSQGTKVLVDGAQAVAHMPVAVEKLGCDFYAFSGHKLYGPMGIGGLWVKGEVLDEMGPFITGGGTISEVTMEGTVFAEAPEKFEGGTPNVAGAVGLAAAIDYVEKIGRQAILTHERGLIGKLLAGLSRLSFVRIYGPKHIEERVGVVAFTVDKVHAHDVAQVLDSEGVAVRSGHHCVMPMHTKLKLSATTRASFGIYNAEDDIEALLRSLDKVRKVFRI